MRSVTFLLEGYSAIIERAGRLFRGVPLSSWTGCGCDSLGLPNGYEVPASVSVFLGSPTLLFLHVLNLRKAYFELLVLE